MVFELPEDMDLSQYSSVSIKAKVGSQLMVDFADETLLANMENGMLLNADYTMTAEEMYPFFFDGSEGANLKYGTETTVIKGEDALSGSKYITIGTCKYPEEAEEAGREYVFYLYSITFHPSSDEDEKIVLSCKQPDIVQPTLEPSATPEPSSGAGNLPNTGGIYDIETFRNTGSVSGNKKDQRNPAENQNKEEG